MVHHRERQSIFYPFGVPSLTVMTRHANLRPIVERSHKAGIERCAPHHPQRTFASELFDWGAVLLLVQRLLGHASRGTTAISDRRLDEDSHLAVSRLPISMKPDYEGCTVTRSPDFQAPHERRRSQRVHTVLAQCATLRCWFVLSW